MTDEIRAEPVRTTSVRAPGAPARGPAQPRAGSSLATLATPVLPEARSARVVTPVPTARLSLVAPGSTGAATPPAGSVPAGRSVGAALVPPSSGAMLEGILARVDLIAANQSRIEELAELTDKTGNVLARIGSKALGVTRDAARITLRLWSGSWLEKVAAFFTGLGTGAMGVIGGVFYGAGWALRTVGGAVLEVFGREAEPPPPVRPDEEREELERRNERLRLELVRQLEGLELDSSASRRAVLQEATERLGLARDRELDTRAGVFVAACKAAGLPRPTLG